MTQKLNLEVVMLRVRTEEGLAKITEDARRCNQQALLHGDTLDGRTYRAIAHGLQMIAVCSPEEISAATVQIGIASATSGAAIGRFELNRAMRFICECIKKLTTYEQQLIMRKKKGRDFHLLATSPTPV